MRGRACCPLKTRENSTARWSHKLLVACVGRCHGGRCRASQRWCAWFSPFPRSDRGCAQSGEFPKSIPASACPVPSSAEGQVLFLFEVLFGQPPAKLRRG